MSAKFSLKCRTAPVGSEGPLVPNLMRGGPAGRTLCLSVPSWRNYPKGFTIDGMMTFDMQDDGGVDQIEIYQRMGGALNSGVVKPRAGEKYRRLFLHPYGRTPAECDFQVAFKRVDNVAHFRFDEGEVDREYLLGPGVAALVAGEALVGLTVDLRGFMDKYMI